MATVSQPAKAAVLNSWKEIASYLGRGVRTVQRYEHELGLPVRRPRGKSRSAVIALTSDLDLWLKRTPQSVLDSRSAKEALPHAVMALHESLREADALHDVCRGLRRANLDAIETLSATLNQTRELVKISRQAHAELALARETGGAIRRTN